MNPIEKMLNEWINGIKEDHIVKCNNDHSMDILHIIYKPRFKHFRPPMWKIFMWAYKVERKTLFKGCYPSSIKSDMDTKVSKTLDIVFSCNPYHSPEVDKVAEKLKEDFCNGNQTSSGKMDSKME